MMIMPSRIKVDLIKDVNGPPLLVTTGIMTEAQRALVKEAMPIIEQAHDKGILVHVQGNSIVLEQKVDVVWNADGGALPRMQPVTVSKSNIEDKNKPYMIVNGTLIINEVKCDRCQAKAPA